MILLIDNYDSFVYNLRRYLVRLGETVDVVRNDEPQLLEFIELAQQTSEPRWLQTAVSDGTLVRAIVISPGPKRPEEAGYCLELIRSLSGRVPLLGICLGHQAICQAFGGQVVRAREPLHGRATPIELLPSPLFDSLQSESAPYPEFARYHSLVAQADSLPACLQVIAWSLEREIMALTHTQHPTFGIQFHPESILSSGGYRILSNFLALAGKPAAQTLPENDYGPPMDNSSGRPASGGEREETDEPWEHSVPFPIRAVL